MKPQSIVIAGGGITGLVAAYLSSRAGHQVTILEASPKIGGLLNTFAVGGNQLEYYYHHFFTHDTEILWLLRELDLETSISFANTSMGVYRNQSHWDFNSPLDLLRFSPMTLADKIRFIATSLYIARIAKWKQCEHVSCLEWLNKWAGESATTQLWRPMLEIKFGPYANHVPLAWMVGRMRQRLNSRRRGNEQLGYLHGSFKVLLDRLVSDLNQRGVRIMTETPVESLEIVENSLLSVGTPKGRIDGDKFLFTIPSFFVSNLLEPFNKHLATSLSRIEYFGAVCTIIESRVPFGKYYWLNVADPGFLFGGVIEHTNMVDPKHYNGSHIAYLSRYFAHDEPLASQTTSEIESRMMHDVQRLYPHITDACVKSIHTFRTSTAATVCDLNFSLKIPQCRTEVGGLYLATMAHIYPDERSVNNSIRVASEACAVMDLRTPEVPVGHSLSAQVGFGVRDR